MSKTAIENVTGTFDAETFAANAGLYNESTRLRRAFDAVMACTAGDKSKTIAEVHDHIGLVMAALEEQADIGSGYTPDKALGFGSENGASIAETLLCRRPGASVIRTAFAKCKVS